MYFATNLKRLAAELPLRNLWVAGAFTFDEGPFLLSLWKSLNPVCLFEPLPQVAASVSRRYKSSPNIKVFSCALANFVGYASFNVTNNLASSSLLPLARHREVFPHVATTGTIRVAVRTVQDVIEKEGLSPPDFLLMDVQGSELHVLNGMARDVLENIRVIYTEASTEELYRGSGTLDDIKQFLHKDFEFLGFRSFPTATMHGNALFLNRK